jgi:hypothetical protein
MKAISIIGIIVSAIGGILSFVIYFMCQKILISGNIKAGVFDNLDVENWEELVEFNEFAVQKAEQIQMFSLGMLILFIFLLFQSIYILSKKN